MKKIVSFLLALLLLHIGYAQQKTVTGTVKDEKGAPVPFATITDMSTQSAVQAGENGLFSITVNRGAKLQITSAGFVSQIADADGNLSNIVLKRGQDQLTEVFVTALGVSRGRNQVPYAAQKIAGEEVAKTRTNNFIQNMSGKIAGLEIKQGNTLGASTNVIIRGFKSITGNNQALFVVDGVPYSNVTGTTSSQTGTQRTAGGGYDYGNAAADINPDDIASITVLKGAAASALYGSQGSNGVILITTKKGNKGLGITINSGITAGKVDKTTLPAYQKEYGAGYYGTVDYPDPSGYFLYEDIDGDGVNDLLAPINDDASYGAKFDPSLMVYQWQSFDPSSPHYRKKLPWVAGANDPTTLFETALSSNQSVYIDGASDKGSFKLGYTRNDDKGIMPNSKITKNLINLGATYNLTNRLTAGASINFSNINGRGRYGTGYDGSGGRNLMTSFRQWWQMNVDIQEQKAAFERTGQNITWNIKNTDPFALVPNFWDNPYWVLYKNYETDTRNRYYGNVNLSYRATDWLNFTGRISVDSYDEIIEERRAIGSTGTPSYSRFNRTYRETNFDFAANLNKNIGKDINLKALLGTNIRRQFTSYIRARTNGGLIVPEVYALTNSLNTPNAPEEFEGLREVDGVFAGTTISWKDLITVDATLRRDASSTLPKGNNRYYYPSVSTSFTFSELLSSLNWLSYGKLRANYAQVGSDAPLYSVTDVYATTPPFGSQPQSAVTGTNNYYTKNNPNLKPELTRSAELGLEMAFLQNRLGFDITYYSTKTINQILPVAISRATGYQAKYLNAGSMENKGIELSVNANPVKTKDFSWNMTLNWSQNRNKVVDLFEGAENLQLGTFQGGVSIDATKGQPYGTIRGTDFIYTNGQRTVDADGYYLATNTSNEIIGNAFPDWLGGINNSFRYKNFSFSFLVDMRKGGDLFSLDLYYGMSEGLYKETAGLNDQGKPARAPISEGGGVIMPGVTEDGKANTTRIENVYGTYGDITIPNKAFVYDASYIKLREVVLNYSLPARIISKLKVVKDVDFSLVGRNLWIIHKNLPHADPEETLGSGNLQGYHSGAYPAVRALTFNVKLKF